MSPERPLTDPEFFRPPETVEGVDAPTREIMVLEVPWPVRIWLLNPGLFCLALAMAATFGLPDPRWVIGSVVFLALALLCGYSALTVEASLELDRDRRAAFWQPPAMFGRKTHLGPFSEVFSVSVTASCIARRRIDGRERFGYAPVLLWKDGRQTPASPWHEGPEGLADANRLGKDLARWLAMPFQAGEDKAVPELVGVGVGRPEIRFRAWQESTLESLGMRALGFLALFAAFGLISLIPAPQPLGLRAIPDETGMAHPLTFVVARLLVGSLAVGLLGLIGWWYAGFLKSRGITGRDYWYRPLETLGPGLLAAAALTILGGIGSWSGWWRYLLLHGASHLLQGGLVLLKGMLLGWWLLRWRMDPDRLIPGWKGHLGVVVTLGIFTVVEGTLVFPAFPAVGKTLRHATGIRLQSTPVTCVPTSLAIVMERFGRSITERQATYMVGTRAIGSVVDEGLYGAQALGFLDAAMAPPDFEALLAEDLPFLVAMGDFGGIGIMHCVAVLGAGSETLYLGDPLVGLRKEPRTAFIQAWRGYLIRLGRPIWATEPFPLLSRFQPSCLVSGKEN